MPKDHHVKLALNRWDLDRSRDCGDYIEIFFGLYFFSERQEKFCGYDGPALVMISWNQFITVNFRSDNVYRPYFRGFEFTFTAEPDNSTSPDPKDDGKYLLSQEIIFNYKNLRLTSAGLVPPTQTPPHKPALPATQPRAPPAKPSPTPNTRHTEQEFSGKTKAIGRGGRGKTKNTHSIKTPRMLSKVKLRAHVTAHA